MVFRPYGASRWTQLRRYIVECRRRARSRRELLGLDHNALHDIGLSRCDAEGEGTKPFWMA
jgi:uncharacterized protein YjiS (DUF1127 family)